MDENKPQNTPSTYKVIKLLGKGSFGQAYLVTRSHDKSINIENLSEKEERDTFQEAKILEKMDHSNIIKFFEFFKSHRPRKSLNIVTEYADGGDLGQKIKAQPKNKPFTESQILDYFTQICLAIKHIHNKHIIHRDLKAQNIFLTKNGLVKLGDFGIAKVLDCTFQKAMTMVGTPYYLSPEIVQSKPYSFKSDIWSLGVLLYEMMALKMPFDAVSLPMLTLKIMKGNFPPPPNIYSKDLKHLVMTMLHVDENKRPTASEILKLPFIKSRILNFLSEVEYSKELGKTIKHQMKQQLHKKIPSVAQNTRNIINQITNNDSNRLNTNNNINNSNNTNNNNKNNKNPMNLYNALANQKKIEIGKNEKSLQKQQEKPKENQKPQNVIIISPKQPINHGQVQTPQSFNKEKKKEEISTKEFIKRQTSHKGANSNSENKINSSISNTNNNDNNNTNSINTSSSKLPYSNNDLKNFIKKSRKEIQIQNKEKDNENEDVIWVTKSPLKLPISPEEKQSKIPKIIIVEKTPISAHSSNSVKMITEDNTNKEDEYNAYRYMNQLNKIAIEGKDSDNEDNEEQDTNEPSSSPFTSVDELTKEREELQLDSIESTELKTFNDNTNSNSNNNEEKKVNDIPLNHPMDYSQIEEMKVELEKTLGFELFKALYQCIESSTDPTLYTYNHSKITQQIKNDFTNKNLSQNQIDLLFDKIPDVFSIVSNERMCGFI